MIWEWSQKDNTLLQLLSIWTDFPVTSFLRLSSLNYWSVSINRWGLFYLSAGQRGCYCVISIPPLNEELVQLGTAVYDASMTVMLNVPTIRAREILNKEFQQYDVCTVWSLIGGVQALARQTRMADQIKWWCALREAKGVKYWISSMRHRGDERINGFKI